MTRQPQKLTKTEQLLEAAQGDHKRALEMAVGETERLRQDAQVRIGANGIEDANYASLWRMAQMYAASSMVPDHFKNNPANCFVACELSIRLKCNVFMLMQSMYVVHGKPGLEAKLKIGLANQSGRFVGPIRWRVNGSIENEDREWTAYATDKETGEEVSHTVTWAEVKAEGWLTKSGSKWRTIPEKMGKYRSGSWLIDTVCPEVVMGLPTSDEVREYAGGEAEIQQADLDEVEAMLNATPQKEPANGNPAEVAAVADEAAIRKEFADCMFKMTEAKTINEVNDLERRAKEIAVDDGCEAEATETAEAQRERIRASRGGRSAKDLLPDDGRPDDVAAAMAAEGIS